MCVWGVHTVPQLMVGYVRMLGSRKSNLWICSSFMRERKHENDVVKADGKKKTCQTHLTKIAACSFMAAIWIFTSQIKIVYTHTHKHHFKHRDKWSSIHQQQPLCFTILCLIDATSLLYDDAPTQANTVQSVSIAWYSVSFSRKSGRAWFALELCPWK